MKILTSTAAHGQNPSVLAQEALTRGCERPVAKGTAEDPRREDPPHRPVAAGVHQRERGSIDDHQSQLASVNRHAPRYGA
jgi:hypothetical protein